MAALFSSVCVTVTLLLCVPGSHAVDLLRATSISGSPSSIPTVQCRCSVYPNVTFCMWPEASPSPPTRYVTSYSEQERHESRMQCQLIPPGSSSSAPTSAPSSSSPEQLWYCHLPNLKLLTNYILNITAVYPAGTSSHLTSFSLEDIVKPDPPVNVRVSPHVRNLRVEWSPPPAWTNLDIFPLKYHIMYQWENRGAPKFVNLGPVENTTVELKGLAPGRSYLFQVCAKELLGFGECSDWSSPVKVTIPRART